MRIAAGILMIIVGITTPALTQNVLVMVAGTTDYDTIAGLGAPTVLPVLILLGLTVVGGFCTFRKKCWWLALSGAICSAFIGLANLFFGFFGFIFLSMGALAVIFLVKRKCEFD